MQNVFFIGEAAGKVLKSTKEVTRRQAKEKLTPGVVLTIKLTPIMTRREERGQNCTKQT